MGEVTDVDTLRAALTGATAVIHMAAATSAGRLDPAVAYRVNVGASGELSPNVLLYRKSMLTG